MQNEIIELEKILNEEIEAYSQIEKFIVEKKDSLINCDMDKLKNIDYDIEQKNHVISMLESKRINVMSKVCKEKLTLQDIIARIEDKNQAERLLNTRDRIKTIISSIKKQNVVCNGLINHGLKLVEYSIRSIANALVPEGASYNRLGKTKQYQPDISVSSIIQEA